MGGNLWLQAVAVSTLSLCLFIMGLIFLASFSLDGFLNRISTGAALRLVLPSGLNAREGASLALALQEWPEVRSSRYLSPQDGLGRLGRRFGSLNLLEGLEENPLPAIIEVELAADVSPDAFTARLAGLGEVAEVVEARPWLQRLEQIRRLIRLITFALSLVMFLALALVVSNTMRLAVYVRREQLIILDMLGAGRFYMREPFILEAILQALLAGLFSSLGLAALIYIIPLLPETPLWLSAALPLGLPWEIPLYLTAINVLAGLAGSWLGVSRILRLPDVA
jgi:cell division transport system permease protein